MSRWSKLAVACAALLAPLAAACGTASGEASTDESNLVSDAGADAPNPRVAAAQAKLSGNWTNARPEGATPFLAYVLRPKAPNQLFDASFSRDRLHVPIAGEAPPPANAVDRSNGSYGIDSATDDASGTLHLRFSTTVNGVFASILETYAFHLQTEASGQTTLSLTALSSTADAGAPLPAPFTLTRTDSWCAQQATSFLPDPKSDCATAFKQTWFPADVPVTCAGKERNCELCDPVAHACSIVPVSTCELTGFTCAPDLDRCEFTAGKPTGRGTQVGDDGTPIDCRGSPTGNSICCKRTFLPN